MREMTVHFNGFRDMAQVDVFKKGINVGSRTVLVDDLVRSLVAGMPEAEVLSMINDSQFSLTEAMQNAVKQEKDSGLIVAIFEVVIAHLETEIPLEKHHLYVSLLNQLMKRVSIADVDASYLQGMFESTLQKVELLSNAQGDAFNDLLRYLLEHLDLYMHTTQPIGEFLQKITEVVQNTENNELLKMIFHAISIRCQDDWIDEILSQRRPILTGQTPILPKSCIYYHKQLDGTECLLLEVDKGQRPAVTITSEFENVGFPKLLFAFWIKERQIARLRLLTVKDEPVSLESPTYIYPYSNVWSDCRVCWKYEDFVIHDFHHLEAIIQLFFEARNNNHLVHGDKDIDELFGENAGKPFDCSVLKPSRYSVGACLDL